MRLRLLSVLALFVLGFHAATAQSITGTDFVFGLTSTEDLNPTGAAAIGTGGALAVTLRVSSVENANFQVKDHSGAVVASGSVSANSLTTVQVPITYQEPYPEMGNPLPLGLRLTSDKPVAVVVFVLNPTFNDGDATAVFPTSTLGKTYVVATWQDDHNFNDCFEVVATQDNTQVTLATTASAWILGAMQSAGTHTVTLNALELINVCNRNLNDDLTGSFVTADKPVAVFGFNDGAAVQTQNDWNFIFEQLPSIGSLHSSAVEVPLHYSSIDHVRVVAAFDNTQVSRNGAILATLGKGQKYDFVNSNNDYGYFVSSQPALFMQLSDSLNTAGATLGLMPAPTELLNLYIISTSQYFTNWANIFIASGSESQLTINGNPLVATWHPIPNTNPPLIGAQYQLNDHQDAVYTVTTNDGSAFGLTVFGFGNTWCYLYGGGYVFTPAGGPGSNGVLTSDCGCDDIASFSNSANSVSYTSSGSCASISFDSSSNK